MPVITIGENTTDDYSGLYMTGLKQNAADTNLSTQTVQEVSKYGGTNHQHGIILIPGLSNVPAGATINSATLYIYQSVATASYDIDVRRLLRTTVEGECTWNIYSTGNSWATAGGLGAGTDRVDTPLTSPTIDATTGEYKAFTGLATYVQAIVDSTYSNLGLHLERADAGEDSTSKTFRTDNHATDGNRPYIEIDYTTGGDTTPPTFTSGPTANTPTTSGHTISSTLDENGTIYAVRLTDGATAPSSAQVKAGTDASDTPVESDSVSASSGVSADVSFNGGSASTAYDYYVVAEDTSSNLQTSPTLVEATTSPSFTITSNISTSVIPDSTILYSVIYSISGDITITDTPSSTINYVPPTYTQTGSIIVSVTPSSTMTYLPSYTIQGDITVGVTPTSTITYVGVYTIQGDITVSVSPSSIITYSSNQISEGGKSLSQWRHGQISRQLRERIEEEDRQLVEFIRGNMQTFIRGKK